MVTVEFTLFKLNELLITTLETRLNCGFVWKVRCLSKLATLQFEPNTTSYYAISIKHTKANGATPWQRYKNTLHSIMCLYAHCIYMCKGAVIWNLVHSWNCRPNNKIYMQYTKKKNNYSCASHISAHFLLISYSPPNSKNVWQYRVTGFIDGGRSVVVAIYKSCSYICMLLRNYWIC